MEDTAEGLLLTLQVRREQEIVQWLLSWGQQVKVLEPLSLRALLAEEATGIVRLIFNSSSNLWVLRLLFS